MEIITFDGQEKKRINLSENENYAINLDNNYNEIMVKDGVVRMENANCRDGLCINMGEIKDIGETIVCLPHKVVVSIEEE